MSAPRNAAAAHSSPREPAVSMAMLPHEYRVMFEIEEDYWWYRGLRVLVQELLAQYAKPDGSSRILDAGCGTGKNLELLSQRGDARGIDISQQAIEFCRLRGIPANRAMVASVLELPFANKNFDLIFSFDVICNIEDDVAALRELGRTLAPGGRAIVQLPAYSFLWSAHDVAVGHKRRYDARDLRARIERAGLEVETLTYLNMTLFPLIALARLGRRQAHYNGDTSSDLVPLPQPVNAVLTRLYSAEMRRAPRGSFPFGISLLAVARRP